MRALPLARSRASLTEPFVLKFFPFDYNVYFYPESWPLVDPASERSRFMKDIRASRMTADAIRGTNQLSDAELVAEGHQAWRNVYSGNTAEEGMFAEVLRAKKLEQFAVRPHAFAFPNVDYISD